MKKKIGMCFSVTVCIFLLGVACSNAATTDVTVGSHAMPWTWVNGGLNTGNQFGVLDGIGPVLLSSGDGFSFAAGGTFTISYNSGLTSAGGGFGLFDANGNPNFVFNNAAGSSGRVAPSAFMSPATYPIFLMELVGTFADSTGAIVGTPFEIGNGPANFTVPVGATQLQLGINDDIFGDNGGSFSIHVSGPSLPTGVPEPATMLLLGCGLVGVATLRKKYQN